MWLINTTEPSLLMFFNTFIKKLYFLFGLNSAAL